MVVDLRDEAAFPDGMIVTPNHRSVLIAFYDFEGAASGEVRQYGLRDSQLEAIWRLPGSPQATCPQLIRRNGRVMLVVTTAVEHMAPARQARCPNAGCLLVGETPFEDVPDTPVFRVAE